MSQYFNLSLGDLGRHRTAAVALLPVVLPSVYVVYLNWTVRRSTASTSGQYSSSGAAASISSSSSSSTVSAPKSIPKDVLANPDAWVVTYERVVSHPLSAATLVDKLLGGHGGAGAPSPLFRKYLHATFKAFSWTPQAFLLRAMVTEPERKQSFSAAYIDALNFDHGDVVDGMYKVTSYEREMDRGIEVVEASIDAPASYKGPPVRGLILSAVEEHGAEEVVFVNETWMWRGVDEKPTLLESGFGKWFHGLLAGWLVTKGLADIVRR